ncbi:NAD-dependent epimerase/dehydratase family protein [Streptomyces sp. NPDC058818]|uniref:NAD-dependent epimerase/dehydratase family protein n=1 Tax=Streptomyces sp. NPDC058818 TaxID=3346640 RepID=UPI0036C2C61F
MRVLLTGATGYTGLIVASRLMEAGAHVRGLASRPSELTQMLESTGDFTFHQGDLRDAQTLTEAVKGVDAIVHFAAIVGDPASAREPDLARQVNVEATKVLFDVADRSGVNHLVFGSTCSVYGRHTRGVATETTPVNPVSLYGETKVEAENYLLDQGSDVNVTVLRLATAYGVSPKMRLDLIVNQYVHEATARGEVTVMGPEAWRPHAHVQDIAQAVDSVLTDPGKARQQIFNVVTENMQLKQVAALASAAHPGSVRINYRATVDDRRDYAVSGDKLLNSLSYKPGWTVAQGIHEVHNHLISAESSAQASSGSRPAAEAAQQDRAPRISASVARSRSTTTPDGPRRRPPTAPGTAPGIPGTTPPRQQRGRGR